MNVVAVKGVVMVVGSDTVYKDLWGTMGVDDERLKDDRHPSTKIGAEIESETVIVCPWALTVFLSGFNCVYSRLTVLHYNKLKYQVPTF